MKLRRSPRSGFSLLEVVVSGAILAVVATSAVASLRSGIATLGATESSSVAIDAVREFSEFTYEFTVSELDALDESSMVPVLGNGETFPGAGDYLLNIDVQAVEDDDPETTTSPGNSSSRVVTVTVEYRGQQVLEAAWLVAEI